MAASNTPIVVKSSACGVNPDLFLEVKVSPVAVDFNGSKGDSGVLENLLAFDLGLSMEKTPIQPSRQNVEVAVFVVDQPQDSEKVFSVKDAIVIEGVGDREMQQSEVKTVAGTILFPDRRRARVKVSWRNADVPVIPGNLVLAMQNQRDIWIGNLKLRGRRHRSKKPLHSTYWSINGAPCDAPTIAKNCGALSGSTSLSVFIAARIANLPTRIRRRHLRGRCQTERQQSQPDLRSKFLFDRTAIWQGRRTTHCMHCRACCDRLRLVLGGLSPPNSHSFFFINPVPLPLSR